MTDRIHNVLLTEAECKEILARLGSAEDADDTTANAYEVVRGAILEDW